MLTMENNSTDIKCPADLAYSTRVERFTEDGRRNVKLHVLTHAHGKIMWEARTGTCYHILVSPFHRREGIGTYLWEQANLIRRIHHSQCRTDDGEAFAIAIGGPRPEPRIPG